MKFTDAWKLPFKADPSGYTIYIFDSNNKTCFNFYSEDTELYNRIIALLNSDTINTRPFDVVKHDNMSIFVADENNELMKILTVRGWGYLTGMAALNLDYETAVKLQTELIEYASNKLSGK